MMIRERKVKIWLILLIVAVTLALLFFGYQAYKEARVWYENQYFLEMNLLGGDEMSLPYGTEFRDPGAEAKFWGTNLLTEVQNVPVTVEGTVDTSTVGTYELFYSVRIDYKDAFWNRCQTRYMKRVVHVVDENAPVITLNHVEGYYTLPGQTYVEEGYTAWDEYDGDLTDQVIVTSDGKTVTYQVTDSNGNSFITTRDIFYDDPIAPEITLLGEPEIVFTEGEEFTDPGCTASDNVDGDITANIVVTGTVDNNVPGTYTLTYTVSDAWGNSVSTQRTVTVEVKPTPPPTEPPPVELPPPPDVPDVPLPPNGKVIYLTFDDGPSQHTSRLLDVLAKYDVKATFFVVNTGYLSLVSRMANEGHTVALHANNHDYEAIYSSDNAYWNDLKRIQDAVFSYTGQISTIVRFPGGSSNTVSRWYSYGIMTRLTQKMDEMGYRYFDWNIDSDDAGGANTSYEVYCNVVNRISGSGGRNFVVLQHDLWGFSVNAVEDIIQWGLANGYTFAALNMNSPYCEHGVNN